MFAIAAMPAVAGAQVTPAPLAPEGFFDSAWGSGDSVTAECDPDGTSTIRYHIENGAAIGQYPGTFDEDGTITIGPQTNPGSVSVSGLAQGDAVVEATFTIDSPAGQVTGTKRTPLEFTGPFAGWNSQGVCAELSGEIEGRPFVGHEWIVEGAVSYEAVITTEAGQFRDSGVATITLIRGNNVGTPPIVSDVSGFFENFLSSGGVTPLLPTSKQQCDDGSFEEFPGFKNRGDCVSFVATEGKNEPGQNLPGLP